MALKWTEEGMGIQYGYLADVKVFTLLEPDQPDGYFTVSCDFPGRKAGEVVAQKFQTAGAAKNYASNFASWWLTTKLRDLTYQP